MILQSLVTRAGIGVLLVAGLVGAGWYQGGKSARAALDQERRDHRVTKGYYAEILRGLAAKSAEAARKADAASKAVARERAENDRREQEAANAHDREIADLRRRLRDGSVSLQPWWACDLPGPQPGDAAATASGQDTNADLRSAGALGIVQGADAADRWIEWLQFELVSTREAVKAAGCAVEAE